MLMLSRLAPKLAVPFFLLASLGMVFVPVVADAQGASANQTGGFGLDATVGEINKEKGSVYDLNASPEQIIGRIIKYILQFTGIVFFILMVYAGIIWMTAQGDQKKVTEAKETITRAVIGVIIIAMAYGITSFVLTSVSGEGDPTTTAPAGGTD